MAATHTALYTSASHCDEMAAVRMVSSGLQISSDHLGAYTGGFH